MSRLSSLCLLTTMISVIGYELFLPNSVLVFIAGIALGFFFVIQRNYINKLGKIIICMALLSAVLLVWIAEPFTTLERAVNRAAFFAAFLAALAFIRLAAQRSIIVQRCGQLVVSQPPSRRYGIITMSSYLFGNVLNFGVIHLLGMMIEKGNNLQAAGGNLRVQDARRKRMSLALLRGFALLPLASPFSIALALMLANMPQLQWVPLMLMGGVAAILIFFIGWLLDYLQNPVPAQMKVTAAVEVKKTVVSWKDALPFLAIIIGIFILSISIERLADVSLSVAILIVFPISGLIWFVIESLFFSKTPVLSQLVQDIPNVMNDLRSEIAIISSACFFGAIMTDVIPKELVMGLLETLDLSEVLLSVFLCFLVAAIAHFGISPFISATFLASALAPLLIGKYSPEMIALGLISGWSLATSGSPVSIAALIVSAINGQSSQVLAYKWNALYSIISLLVMCLWIVLLAIFIN